MLDRIVAEKWLTARGRDRPLAGRQHRRRRGGVRRRQPQRDPRHPAQPAPASRKARANARTSAWPTSSHRRTPARPTGSAASPSPRASASSRTWPASRPTTTTIPRSCSRHWPTASPKPSPNTCTSACARSSGASPRTNPSTTMQLIAENYRGIRPAPGYPACPDHTEKPTLFQLLDVTAQHRHRAHRGLGDVPHRRGLRLVLLAPGQPVLRGRPPAARSRSRTTPGARAGRMTEAERWLAPNLDYDPE